MFIDRLRCHIKNLKYIHLARNGLDMALSKNQNQLRIWGDAILGSNCTVSPTHSLQFWCWAQKRILRIGKEFGDDFLFIKFEDLCEYPDRTVTRVLDFINIKPTTREIERLANLIAAPPSIGRHQTVNIQQFNPQDVEYVRSLGFRVQL